MAVGASHPEVFRMIIFKGFKLTLIGVVSGLLCGVGVERAIVSLLYDVRPGDPLVYAGACAIVTAVALAASSLPAMRAAHVDPVAALKSE
jgi:ABC-type antimicrobial peptide transport system permease subunit